VSGVSSLARPAALRPAPRPERAPNDIGLLARSGSLGLVGIVASGLFQLLLVVAVTRGLGTAGAGVFLETLALFMILGRIGELGANTGLVRTVARFRALSQTVDLHRTLVVAAWPVALVGAFLALGTFVLAPQLAAVFFDAAHEAKATELIRLLAPLVPLTAATTVGLAASRGFGTMLPYVLVQNIGLPAARFVAVFAVVVAGLGSVAAGIAWALPMAAACAASVALLVRLLRRAQRTDAPSSRPARAARELAAEFWRFSAPRGIAGILGIAVTWMDVLLVGALRSTREAAIYAAASRLAIVGAYALQAVGMAIAPRISALLARDEGERVEALYRTATWWLMALAWPFYLAVAVCSPWIMGVFGPEFVAGATALTILSFAMLVNLATGNVTTVLLMGGKSSWSLFNAAASLVINITLNLILTPRMGITGAAIAWAVSLTFVNIAPVVQVRLFLRLRPPWGSGFVLVALAAGACYGALGLATRYGLGLDAATVALFVVTATGIYIPLLWPFRELLHFSELLNGLQLRGRGPRLGQTTAQAATE
jgi:O-antigen/teichoic acid export membrane protein